MTSTNNGDNWDLCFNYSINIVNVCTYNSVHNRAKSYRRRDEPTRLQTHLRIIIVTHAATHITARYSHINLSKSNANLNKFNTTES